MLDLLGRHRHVRRHLVVDRRGVLEVGSRGCDNQIARRLVHRRPHYSTSALAHQPRVKGKRNSLVIGRTPGWASVRGPEAVRLDLAGADDFSAVCQSLLHCVRGRVEGRRSEKGVVRWRGF